MAFYVRLRVRVYVGVRACVCLYLFMPHGCDFSVAGQDAAVRTATARRLLDVQLECNLLWKLSLHLSVKFTLGCLTVVACCHVGMWPMWPTWPMPHPSTPIAMLTGGCC